MSDPNFYFPGKTQVSRFGWSSGVWMVGLPDAGTGLEPQFLGCGGS